MAGSSRGNIRLPRIKTLHVECNGDSSQCCSFEYACGLFFFFFSFKLHLCVFVAFTFIMVIIHGSQRWLLHAVCPLSWRHKKGMAHALWPASSLCCLCVCVCVFVCLLVSLMKTFSKYNSSSVFFCFFSPPLVCVCVWVPGVMSGLRSCERKRPSVSAWRQTGGGTIRRRDRPHIHSSAIT